MAATTTNSTNTKISPPPPPTTHHAALFCSPGMGHTIPMLEFAKRLVTHKIISNITFFQVSIKNSDMSQGKSQEIQSAKESNLFQIIILPPIDNTTTLGPRASPGYKMAYTMKETVPHLSRAISDMPPNQKPNILITDMLGCVALPLAEEHQMKKYVLLPNALLAAHSLHTPTLDKIMKGEYLDQTSPIKIPGLTYPVDPRDLYSPMLNRNDPQYHSYVRDCGEIKKVDGILVRTFHEMEPKTIEALKSGEITKVPVYVVGPVIRQRKQSCGGDEKRRSYVLDWLDQQEEESVIYVSLGSGYTTSYEQIKETALGLELSGKKFVWSMRPPASTAGFDHYLTQGEDAARTNGNGVLKGKLPSDLPEELYRIQNMGLVVMDWAPQCEILRHPSIGGFVSHVGWNSVMESVSCGVPIVAWPLFGEQRMNASMLDEEAGVGVRLKVSVFPFEVESGEIARAIKKIMDKDSVQGCAIRKRVKELKHIASNAWSRDGPALSHLASVFLKTNHSNGV